LNGAELVADVGDNVGLEEGAGESVGEGVTETLLLSKVASNQLLERQW
jgi:hypothetical protein